MEDNKIILLDEEGNEMEFEIIMTLDVEGVEYAILAQEGDEESAVVLRMDYDADGELMLVPIEDDEEYENVVSAYEVLAEEEEL
ncbi:hypothetical protein EAL2_c12560 [Peptoclostridium acidaminophilum DSM 3953]|uniref:UPF0473 protein EAL2_c12560 n=1 Tax=Peptoclostridium acidaminophilum DSM 3953 TaxID=1286171 RepID=W8U6K3_PEPAC|nr:DUF1292 domain-containing protein [Peptoclostridium acidaminophilum]AHM56551.1 hypothetical protein EAL2_c12560 [Peptoclostridium acidaminophilum DSM 3953]